MERIPNANSESKSIESATMVKNTETGEVFDYEKLPLRLSETLSTDGVYEHYKSRLDDPKYYLVSGIAENTETGENFVLYEPLYETAETERFARPLQMFTEEVQVEGISIPRFRFVTHVTEFFD